MLRDTNALSMHICGLLVGCCLGWRTSEQDECLTEPLLQFGQLCNVFKAKQSTHAHVQADLMGEGDALRAVRIWPASMSASSTCSRFPLP